MILLSIIVGLLLGQLALSRLFLLLLRRMGQTFPRLLVAQALAFAIATFVCAYLAVGDLRRLDLPANALPCLVVAALWFVVDALVLMRRRAKIRDAVYISRMR